MNYRNAAPSPTQYGLVVFPLSDSRTLALVRDDLRAEVEECLQEDNTATWDAAVRDIAISDLEDGSDA